MCLCEQDHSKLGVLSRVSHYVGPLMLAFGKGDQVVCFDECDRDTIIVNKPKNAVWRTGTWRLPTQKRLCGFRECLEDQTHGQR